MNNAVSCYSTPMLKAASTICWILCQIFHLWSFIGLTLNLKRTCNTRKETLSNNLFFFQKRKRQHFQRYYLTHLAIWKKCVFTQSHPIVSFPLQIHRPIFYDNSYFLCFFLNNSVKCFSAFF